MNGTLPFNWPRVLQCVGVLHFELRSCLFVYFSLFFCFLSPLCPLPRTTHLITSAAYVCVCVCVCVCVFQIALFKSLFFYNSHSHLKNFCISSTSYNIFTLKTKLIWSHIFPEAKTFSFCSWPQSAAGRNLESGKKHVLEHQKGNPIYSLRGHELMKEGDTTPPARHLTTRQHATHR